MTYYAHTRGSEKTDWQTVLQHLSGTADQARRIGADTGLADFAAAAAMLHDIGKYSLAFQRRLEGGPKVDHATAGALEMKNHLTKRGQALAGWLLAYCIAGHHGGLPDCGSPVDTEEESTLLGRFKRTLNDYSAFASEVDASSLHVPSRLTPHFWPNREAPGFSVSFATRMIYSILVDADFLETETFCNGGAKARGGYAEIPALATQFEQHLQRFGNPQREIDRRRSAALRACVDQAALPPGLFTLTLPTGAGKTLTSMAFAMRHAVENGLKRIVYVIPYTSIIEQNTAVFRDSLGGYEDQVLEHHSNFDWNADDDSSGRPDSALQKLRWAAENWDVPVVVTTSVQFFESLFASRSSRSRKIHNLAKSVIIFDEAQMLPRDLIRPCIFSVVELIKNYGASAVFCTATQPALERFLPDGAEMRELIQDPQAEFDFYRRVHVRMAGRLTDDELLERLNRHTQALCIVNTRRHAKALYDRLAGEGCFHLSTLMCAAHRRVVIAEIRQRLAADMPCRVISTQLLEAGVDLDFPVGYRALAGLESLVQSAGRVNREGRLTSGELIVFEPDSPHARSMPKYIQQTAKVAKLVLGRFSDPVSVEAVRAYYSELYGLCSPDAFDSRKVMECFEKGVNPPAFNFTTAAERFRLIEKDTVPVIVPYDTNARRLLEELETTLTPFAVMRKLQPYVVNIYSQEYEALEGSGAVRMCAETYAVLNEALSRYDPHTGLVIPDRRGGIGIIVDE